MLKTSMLKQLGGVKNHVFDHEARKSGLFPCYRLKINDFLSNYNQNLKIDIFTPLQQIPCYCKNSLCTLRLISWWRVTYDDYNADDARDQDDKNDDGNGRGDDSNEILVVDVMIKVVTMTMTTTTITTTRRMLMMMTYEQQKNRRHCYRHHQPQQRQQQQQRHRRSQLDTKGIVIL